MGDDNSPVLSVWNHRGFIFIIAVQVRWWHAKLRGGVIHVISPQKITSKDQWPGEMRKGRTWVHYTFLVAHSFQSSAFGGSAVVALSLINHSMHNNIGHVGHVMYIIWDSSTTYFRTTVQMYFNLIICSHFVYFVQYIM